jgi:hypothetical protein
VSFTCHAIVSHSQLAFLNHQPSSFNIQFLHYTVLRLLPCNCESNFHCFFTITRRVYKIEPSEQRPTTTSPRSMTIKGSTRGPAQCDDGCERRSLPSSKPSHDDIPPFFNNIGYDSSKIASRWTAFIKMITRNIQAATSNIGRRCHTRRLAARCLQNFVRRFARRHLFSQLRR